MAISKGFFDKRTSGVDEFLSFLNEHKTGTFLENIDLVSSTDESPSYPRLTFKHILEGTGNIDQVTILTSSGNDYKSTVKYQTERDGVWRDFATDDSGQTEFYRYMYDCLLCTNGLIVRQRMYTSNDYRIITPFILTVDNNGRLVVFCVNKGKSSIYSVDDNYSTYASYLVMSDQTPTVKSIATRSTFTTNRTCLAPIAVPASNQVDLYLPHTWVASQTQLSSPGLYAVKINGVDYITNGTIYIRDTPAE